MVAYKKILFLTSKTKKNSAFTLLEVMVAMAILALAVTTLLIIRNDAIQQAGVGMESRRLKMLLEEKMGEVASNLEKKTSGFFQNEETKDYFWEIKTEVVPLKSAPDILGKVFTVNLKKVHVSVRHKNADASRALSIEAYFPEENTKESTEDNILDEEKNVENQNS